MMKKNQRLPHLGNLTAKEFLRDYWQKKPMLIRKAFPGFVAPLTKTEVIELAGREEAESRLITCRKNKWDLQHGPFPVKDFRALNSATSTTQWTVLVQDTQHFSFEAHELLAMFNFIPTARVDDLMVSLANDGGGVGPHVDSYDVFLLQGIGKRRWQISTQKDLSLKADAPLKTLQNFKPDEEWLLEAGDMLYLPPHVAHHGVAEGDGCMTWSIGFRAPDKQELSMAFLDFLRDELVLDGNYTDHDLAESPSPGEIDVAMAKRFSAMLADTRSAANNTALFNRFLGCYLSEPKAHVMFDPPEREMGIKAFARAVAKRGLELDLRARLLFMGGQFYLDGTPMTAPGAATSTWCDLANTRRAAGDKLDPLSQPDLQLFYAVYLMGYLHVAR
jgi:50S ribosomal protein L16 3-hydroxylase